MVIKVISNIPHWRSTIVSLETCPPLSKTQTRQPQRKAFVYFSSFVTCNSGINSGENYALGDVIGMITSDQTYSGMLVYQ